MRNSSLKRSGMARVNEGAHSFTCHPHVYPQVELDHQKLEISLWNPLYRIQHTWFPTFSQNAHNIHIFRNSTSLTLFVVTRIKASPVWRDGRNEFVVRPLNDLQARYSSVIDVSDLTVAKLVDSGMLTKLIYGDTASNKTPIAIRSSDLSPVLQLKSSFTLLVPFYYSRRLVMSSFNFRAAM